MERYFLAVSQKEKVMPGFSTCVYRREIKHNELCNIISENDVESQISYVRTS